MTLDLFLILKSKSYDHFPFTSGHSLRDSETNSYHQVMLGVKELSYIVYRQNPNIVKIWSKPLIDETIVLELRKQETLLPYINL